MSAAKGGGNGTPSKSDAGGREFHALLEAMLFVSNEPVALDEMVEAIEGASRDDIEAGLSGLSESFEGVDRGVKIEKVAGGYRLVTKPDLASSLRALFRQRNRKRLTPATLDVLSIIAYAQPITAPEIQEIRGSDPSYALGVLHDRRLVKVVGRKKVVGRPILHGTTREFLLHFGLDTLADLPPVEAYGTHVVPAQKRLFPVGNDLAVDEGLEVLEGVDAEGSDEETRAEPAAAISDAEGDLPIAPVGASPGGVTVAEP